MAQEHHDLEKSLVNSVSYYHSPPRSQSTCMSDTDIEEYFDAFDDAEDSKSDDKTLTQSSDDEFNSATIQTITGDYVTPQTSMDDLCGQTIDDSEWHYR